MPQPMYQQIADVIRSRIESGILEPGQQLPTELELRDEFGASRNTVRDAIKRLTTLKLVESRPGSGTFVSTKIDPFVTVLSSTPELAVGSIDPADPEGAAYLSEVENEHRKATWQELRVSLPSASEEVAKRLRLLPATQVICRSRKRYIDKIPWSLQSTYYPREFATKAPRLLDAEDVGEGTVRYLQEVTGKKQASYRDWITARAASEAEQQFFMIPHGTIVFEIFRTGFDQYGDAMRVTVTVYPVDRQQFIVNAGNPPDPQYDGTA
jgi:GntR family transcriptional regulator